ncbi:MAG: hypothetical protein ACE5HX_09690 [bacterium]
MFTELEEDLPMTDNHKVLFISSANRGIAFELAKQMSERCEAASGSEIQSLN